MLIAGVAKLVGVQGQRPSADKLSKNVVEERLESRVGTW